MRVMTKRQTQPAKKGRPCNETAYRQMIQLLKRKKGATVPQLIDRLELPRRTIYHYLKKMQGEGHRVVKLGSENSAPFSII